MTNRKRALHPNLASLFFAALHEGTTALLKLSLSVTRSKRVKGIKLKQFRLEDEAPPTWASLDLRSKRARRMWFGGSLGCISENCHHCPIFVF